PITPLFPVAMTLHDPEPEQEMMQAPPTPAEDVWAEYDDLCASEYNPQDGDDENLEEDYYGRPFSLEFELEQTASGRGTQSRSGSKSNTSSLGAPFQFDNFTSTYRDVL